MSCAGRLRVHFDAADERCLGDILHWRQYSPAARGNGEIQVQDRAKHVWVVLHPSQSSTCCRRTSGSAKEMTDFVQAAIQNAPALLRHNALSLVPVAAFAVFVYVNKGITVGTVSTPLRNCPCFCFELVIGLDVTGDKEHHQPVAHFAQVPYFFLFCSSLLGLIGSQSLLSRGTNARAAAGTILLMAMLLQNQSPASPCQ